MIKIRMLKDVFGLAKGFIYNAERHDTNTYTVTNGTFKGVVFNEDVEVAV